MTQQVTPLEFYVDFMWNKIVVGDAVIAVRVPDRTPQIYTGRVEEIRLNKSYYREIVQIKVLPTGGYSTPSWRHGDLKANWIQAQNVLKYS